MRRPCRKDPTFRACVGRKKDISFGVVLGGVRSRALSVDFRM